MYIGTHSCEEQLCAHSFPHKEGQRGLWKPSGTSETTRERTNALIYACAPWSVGFPIPGWVSWAPQLIWQVNDLPQWCVSLTSRQSQALPATSPRVLPGWVPGTGTLVPEITLLTSCYSPCWWAWVAPFLSAAFSEAALSHRASWDSFRWIFLRHQVGIHGLSTGLWFSPGNTKTLLYSFCWFSLIDLNALDIQGSVSASISTKMCYLKIFSLSFLSWHFLIWWTLLFGLSFLLIKHFEWCYLDFKKKKRKKAHKTSPLIAELSSGWYWNTHLMQNGAHWGNAPALLSMLKMIVWWGFRITQNWCCRCRHK